jgi:hypothetical protein
VTIPFVQASSVDLREASQPLYLELLDRTLQLREVLLDASIGQLRERFGSQRLHN